MNQRSLASLAIVVGACQSRPPVASCDDDLHGVWHASSGDYQAVPSPAGVDLYPLFRDLPGDLPTGIVTAPAVLSISRSRPNRPIRATMTRRYERGAELCRIQNLATVIMCAGDTIHVEVAAPRPPSDWAKCIGADSPVQTITLRRW